MPATFYSPIFGTSYSFTTGKRAALIYQLKRKLARMGNKEFGQEMKQLTGSAVGANTVTVTDKRAVAPTDGFVGGSRAIENQFYVRSSITTAADETEVDGATTIPTALTFRANGDGNPRGNAGG